MALILQKLTQITRTELCLHPIQKLATQKLPIWNWKFTEPLPLLMKFCRANGAFLEGEKEAIVIDTRTILPAGPKSLIRKG